MSRGNCLDPLFLFYPKNHLFGLAAMLMRSAYDVFNAVFFLLFILKYVLFTSSFFFSIAGSNINLIWLFFLLLINAELHQTAHFV